MFLSLIYSLMYRYNSYIFFPVTGFVALVCESSSISLYGQCTIMDKLSFQLLWNMKFVTLAFIVVKFSKIIWLLKVGPASIVAYWLFLIIGFQELSLKRWRHTSNTYCLMFDWNGGFTPVWYIPAILFGLLIIKIRAFTVQGLYLHRVHNMYMNINEHISV